MPEKISIESFRRECCGQPMSYQEVFGIRIYHCIMRHHTVFYENLQTGEIKSDEQLMTHMPKITEEELCAYAVALA